MHLHAARRGGRLARRGTKGRLAWSAASRMVRGSRLGQRSKPAELAGRGLALGTASRVLRGRGSGRHSRSTELAALGVGGAAGFAASKLDRRRRHMARNRVASVARHAADRTARRSRFAGGRLKGAAHSVAANVRPERSYDDVTLARKVESELFRPGDAPKGSVDVNAVDGVVELRGHVDDLHRREELVERCRRIAGVKDVRDMLGVPQNA